MLPRISPRLFALASAAMIAVIHPGCSDPASPPIAHRAVDELRAVPDLPGLHNVLQIDASIFSGGEPQGAEGFASLARLGIRTIVSVDGAQPDSQSAAAHGLAYLHIPIAYDGVQPATGLVLARLVREQPGPFYIHCHHGTHRAPTAAAIAWIASGRGDGPRGLRVLELAGTSRTYPGLWRAVEEYRPPSAGIPLPEFSDVALISNLAAAMSAIDRNFDHLALCREAQWSSPTDHPDLVPALEALLLKEGLRESARHLSGDYSDEFKTWLGDSELLAEQLEQSLRSGNAPAATSQYEALQQACRRCHTRYRN